MTTEKLLKQSIFLIVDNAQPALSTLKKIYLLPSDHTGFLLLIIHSLQLCIAVNNVFSPLFAFWIAATPHLSHKLQ